MKKTIYIDGMMCRNCANSVKAALEKLDGVSVISVEPEDKCAVVNCDSNIEAAIFKDTIENLGFDFIKAE